MSAIFAFSTSAVGRSPTETICIREEAGIFLASLPDSTAGSFVALSDEVKTLAPGQPDLGFVLATSRESGAQPFTDAESWLSRKVVRDLTRPRTTGTFFAVVARGSEFDGSLLLAASCPLLVAEVGATLRPGLACDTSLLYQVLQKRVGRATAARLMDADGPWDAVALYELGVVDMITEAGFGEHTCRDALLQRKERGSAYYGFLGAREAYLPIDAGADAGYGVADSARPYASPALRKCRPRFRVPHDPNTDQRVTCLKVGT